MFVLCTLTLAVGLFVTGCATIRSRDGGSSSSSLPEVTHDGLVLIPDTREGGVWELPEADLSVYNRIVLLEPDISFRTNWRDDQNATRSAADRISAQDMERMIQAGQELLIEEFTKKLENAGFNIVEEKGDEVLVVRLVVLDLDILAPDLRNTAGSMGRSNTAGAGSATLVIELFDSVSRQILVRTSDSRSNRGRPGSFAFSRTQSSNISDARVAFSTWAGMLAQRLEEAKAAANESAVAK